jgi:shikimate kinase
VPPLIGESLAYSLAKTIVVVGLMGAGKTAVGSLVAQKLETNFLDSDREIERAANMTIPEIFARDGEPFFRAKETQVLARLLAGRSCILSTGGGAFMSAKNRDLIARQGVSLWLRADLDLLWARVRHKDTRPLLRGDDPKQVLADLYAARTPIYAKAEIIVDAEPGYSLDDMAQKVVTTLLETPKSGVKETG